MSTSPLAPLLSWLGWMFIPGYATSFLQSFYYKLTVPVGQSPPHPSSPLYAKHHRRIRILVLTLYLVYTVLQSLYDIKLAGDFFTYLSVTPESTDREIKSRFRRLAAKYHPDKIGQQQFTANDEISDPDSRFLTLKLAQDTLLSPTLRFAYTRFGPGITKTSLPDNRTPDIQTYVFSGLRHNLLPSYLVNLVSLIGLNYFILPKWGSYWRYLILFAIFNVELYFLTHSDASLTAVLSNTIHVPVVSSSIILTPLQHVARYVTTSTKLSQLLPPHLLPFQTLSLLRTLSISLNIFISQLAPPRHPAQASPQSGEAGNPNTKLLSSLNQSLAQIKTAGQRLDAESTSLLQLQLTPYKDDSAKTQRLREEMRDGVVLGALLSRPEVKDAVRQAVEKRRAENGRQ